jgi:hypothetical protein
MAWFCQQLWCWQNQPESHQKLAMEPGPTSYKPAKNSFLLETNEKEEVKNMETLSMLWPTGCYSTEQMRFLKYCNRLVCSTENGTEIYLIFSVRYQKTVFKCQMSDCINTRTVFVFKRDYVLVSDTRRLYLGNKCQITLQCQISDI